MGHKVGRKPGVWSPGLEFRLTASHSHVCFNQLVNCTVQIHGLPFSCSDSQLRSDAQVSLVLEIPELQLAAS